MTIKASDKKMINSIKCIIKIYKDHARQTVYSIKKSEAMRIKIINILEELQYQQKLDKRTASLFEDKLSRPYAKLLF